MHDKCGCSDADVLLHTIINIDQYLAQLNALFGCNKYVMKILCAIYK